MSQLNPNDFLLVSHFALSLLFISLVLIVVIYLIRRIKKKSLPIAPLEPNSNEPESITCPNCGEKTPRSESTCVHCGMPINENGTT